MREVVKEGKGVEGKGGRYRGGMESGCTLDLELQPGWLAVLMCCCCFGLPTLLAAHVQSERHPVYTPYMFEISNLLGEVLQGGLLSC